MAKRPAKPLDDLVKNNRIANSYATEFERQRRNLDKLADAAFKARVRGEEPPVAAFKSLATAAHDLWFALEGVRGNEPLEIIRMPAAGLCGAMERLAKALGKIK